MHAVFHYLLHLDIAQSEAQLALNAESLFEAYCTDHTDDNNWWAPIDLVLKDGRNISKFKEASTRYTTAPEPMSWEVAIRYALDCVASDFELVGLPTLSLGKETPEQEAIRADYDKLTIADIQSLIHERIPKRIIEMYQEIVGKAPTREFDHGFDLKSYRRAKLARQYELFRSAKVVPFSTDIESPYLFRAYDLTQTYAEGEPNAIFRLDIHT